MFCSSVHIDDFIWQNYFQRPATIRTVEDSTRVLPLRNNTRYTETVRDTVEIQLVIETQKQLVIETQRQFEIETQRQLEIETQRQLELETQRQLEIET